MIREIDPTPTPTNVNIQIGSGICTEYSSDNFIHDHRESQMTHSFLDTTTILDTKVVSASKDSEESIQEAAYYLWQEAGCPEGLNEYFWFEAKNRLSN